MTTQRVGAGAEVKTKPMKSFFICLLFPAFIYAQQSALSIGDHIPSSAMDMIKNKTGPPGKNQIIILDFFATWCMACISELPKMDSLQKEFNGQLQILLVTQQLMEKIIEFRKKNKIFAAVSFPVIASDTTLKKLFPNKFLPHEVWINGEGKVLAITESSYVTAANIRTLVNGKELRLPVKTDVLDFDFSKPILQDGNGSAPLLYRSILSGRMHGMNSAEGRVKENETTRWYFINRTILSLYQKALGFESNRIILEVSDPSVYLLPASPDDEWKNKNLYSYELTIPASAQEDLFRSLMLNDLNRYFNLDGRIGKRLIKCWALRADSVTGNLLNSKTAKPLITFQESTGNFIFRNQPFFELIKACNASSSFATVNPVIIDESGISLNIDIDIPAAAFHDFNLLQQSLLLYGIHLVPVEKEIEMFILTEPNFNR